MNRNAKSIVSIAARQNYDPSEINESIRSLLTPWNGVSRFIKPGQKVALKPNLLLGSTPEQCVCSHPEIIRAVSELVIEAGGKPFIIDSPGAAIPHKPASLQRLYEKCGLADLGIPLNRDDSYRFVSVPDGNVIKRIEILSPLLDADVIINLPKVKTHSFMILTCAVKNMFGAIPGYLKVGYHSKLRTPEQFGAMLLDILKVVKPSLTIVDGIRGMEGEGPSGGNPRHLGALIAGENPILIDLVVCKLIGFPPEKVPYLALAQNKGICPASLSEIDLRIDADWEALATRFAPPSTMSGKALRGFYPRMLGILRPLLNYAFTLRPEVLKNECVGCGACVKACPEKIIETRKTKEGKNIARIKRRGCIRCYCCHEMCSYKAIRLKKSRLYRLVN